MRMGKFLRVKLEMTIFAFGRNFIVISLRARRNLSLIADAIFHNRKCGGGRIAQITEESIRSERGDVPGWVLVVLMTTGLVTAIWTIAAPRLSAILRNSLDAMNGIR